MDNVVRNINIADIIPSEFQATEEELYKIERLAQLIKNFGIVDPLLVRPKDGKYEIVLGVENYQAAKLAGLTDIPVMIKEIDDKTYSKYLSLDNRKPTPNEILPSIEKKTPKEIENHFTIPLESQSRDGTLPRTPSKQINIMNKNSDIVNLSELSKIKLEYERDDIKMNNGQSGNIMNNNMQPQMNQSQGPTFGGRFFPSLEDEPTNMNMTTNLGNSPISSIQPPVNNNLNNPTTNSNLIDLTDLSVDKEPSMALNNNFVTSQSIQPTQEINSISPANQPLPTNFGISNPEISPIVSPTNNVINIDNLPNGNPPLQTTTPESVSMETLNADFGAPTQQQPQFDMSQNMAPQMEDFAMPDLQNQQQPSMISQPSFEKFSQPSMVPPTRMQEPISQPINTIPSFDSSSNPTITPNPNINTDFELPSSMTNSTSPMEPSAKDLTPVINTIKNLVTSLEAFGYQINLTEEDLSTSKKIIIEVEK